jgi:hypothetical protein
MPSDPIKDKIRAELSRWLWDIEPDRRWTEAEVNSDQLEDFEQRVKTWACEEFVGAHQPERDQCGIPAHDFCLWCGKSMPNSWRPSEPPAPGRQPDPGALMEEPDLYEQGGA